MKNLRIFVAVTRALDPPDMDFGKFIFTRAISKAITLDVMAGSVAGVMVRPVAAGGTAGSITLDGMAGFITPGDMAASVADGIVIPVAAGGTAGSITLDGMAASITPDGMTASLTPGDMAGSVTPDGMAGSVTSGGTARPVAAGGTAGSITPDGMAASITPDGIAASLTPDGTARPVAAGGTAGSITPDGTAEFVAAGGIFGPVIVAVVIDTLPLSYREEARYYFKEQIKQGDSFFPTLFDYFLGGIGYRLRKIIFFLSRYLEGCVNLIRQIKQATPGISDIYCGTRSNI